MSVGYLSRNQALLPVTVRTEHRPSLSIEFVVDTGFVGYRTLPQAAVDALRLPYQFDTPASLADGSEVQMAVHSATIVWNGSEQIVRVLATGQRPLLGMALLEGHELAVQCTEGGTVSVAPLP